MKLRRSHDLGGLEDGPLVTSEHEHASWEKRVDSIMCLLADNKRKLITLDELRRGIEDLGPIAQQEMSYYERWISSLTNILIEKGIIEVHELGRKMVEVTSRWETDRSDSLRASL